MIKLQALARRFISNKSTEAEQIDTPSGDLFQCDGFIRLKTWRPPLPEAWKSTENRNLLMVLKNVGQPREDRRKEGKHATTPSEAVQQFMQELADVNRLGTRPSIDRE